MAFQAFAREHVAQITATVGLVTYALARNKLTPAGIVVGVAVATVHMAHPWPAFFWLLIAFFVVGTGVTKAGHAAKASLTQSSTGGSGGEGARSAAQVFANSGCASILILLHSYLLTSSPFISSALPISPSLHAPNLTRVLPMGIIANYAAVAADTFSSELGILSSKLPVLITNPWKEVPKGTNGGVTVDGLLLGFIGSFALVGVSIFCLDRYEPRLAMAVSTAELLILMGFLGTIIDSLLGALVQSTVTDKRSGKVVEGQGGQRVKAVDGGSRVQIGRDLLTNNGVNFVMAAATSVLAMGVAWLLDLVL